MPEIEAGQLIEVLPDFPVPTRAMHLLYAPDRRMTPKLRSFVDFAIEALGSPQARKPVSGAKA